VVDFAEHFLTTEIRRVHREFAIDTVDEKPPLTVLDSKPMNSL
jgi:hypothetical protein